MIRARFYVAAEDHRPVKWPPPGPYWCTGTRFLGDDDEESVLVAYAESEEQILEYWPEASEIDATPATEYVFTSRFPKPDWWQDGAKA